MSCFPGKKIIGAQSYMEMKRPENKNKAIKKKHDPEHNLKTLHKNKGLLIVRVGKLKNSTTVKTRV